MRIPREVAVVGVEDIPAARFSEPPLSSVHPHLEPQAHAVARATLIAVGLAAPEDEPPCSPAETAPVVRRESS